MVGAGGNDTYFVDNAGDTVVESPGAGNDAVFASVHLTLTANVETLVLQGSADLQGYGNDLTNVIYGNTGNNLLDGGAGADLMVGGAGDDTYFVDNASDAAFENPGEGTDAVFSTAHYGLAADVEILVLQGIADLIQQLVRSHLGVLEDVVEQRGDRLGLRATVFEHERRDAEQVRDIGHRVGPLTDLLAVRLDREGERANKP